MHMADALVSPAVGVTMAAVSVGAIAYSVVKMKKEEDFDEKKVPLMAVSGAFVFAAQMINFTIPGTGSSGHIGGGILLAALLGPYPALLTISAVLLIQCLFFADGGLLALGCNIFNMGIIPCLFAYPLIFKPIAGKVLSNGRIMAASVVAVVIGLQLGAFGVVLETSASNVTALPFGTFLLLMQPIHLAIGIVEGIVTGMVLVFVRSMRPEILKCSSEKKSLEDVSIKKTIIVFSAAALLIAGILSIFASSFPDGLEWAMEKTAGTAELANNGAFKDAAGSFQSQTAFMPDYDSGAAGIVGGLITVILTGITGLIIYLVKRKKTCKA
ncbi:MAG TPA: energy-coupling factor ABC transporter permease [Bacillota bacterium]|nr:energy-coupling factor ABC transporter permease [Bacillota bacterium]HUM55992.1 energy-coupling factor ABC transporter permease [Bacillota bacterium]